MSTKVSALTQATNAELADASLAYVVIDPSGTPASRKSTLARLGMPAVSVIEEARAYYGTPASSATNYTNGLAFQARRDSCTCTGIRAYWDNATSTTLKMSLFDGSGSSLATVNVASSSTGYKTGTFGSPVSLTRGTVYLAAIWDGVRQVPAPQAVYGTGGGTSYLVQPGTMLRDIWVANWGMYAAGDAAPTTVASGYLYLVEPIISG